MQREKGVLSKPCATCGADLVAQTNLDGSTAFISCSKCFPAETKVEEKPANPPAPAKELAAFKAERETGTVVKQEESQ